MGEVLQEREKEQEVEQEAGYLMLELESGVSSAENSFVMVCTSELSEATINPKLLTIG